MPHTGIIVHNVATAHQLCGGPDQLGEVTHLQVAAAVHGGVLVEQLHLRVPLTAGLPPVSCYLGGQWVTVVGASLVQILPHSEPADVIGVMVPDTLVSPQLSTPGQLFIPPQLHHVTGCYTKQLRLLT